MKVLVFETNMSIMSYQIDSMRDKIVDQMKEGVVVVPKGFNFMGSYEANYEGENPVTIVTK